MFTHRLSVLKSTVLRPKCHRDNSVYVCVDDTRPLTHTTGLAFEKLGLPLTKLGRLFLPASVQPCLVIDKQQCGYGNFEVILENSIELQV